MDRFPSMSALLGVVAPRGNYAIHVDRSHRSNVKIFAPHGGCIEPCTEPIVLAVARGMLDCFVFSGNRKRDCFSTLHVTSTHYDEPQCAEMVRESGVAIAVHGCEGEESVIHIGGGNRNLAPELIQYLAAEGYPAAAAPGNIRGEEKSNFINRARREGIQLELSVGFRRSLFPGFPGCIQRHPRDFPNFIDSLRRWIRELEAALSSGTER